MRRRQFLTALTGGAGLILAAPLRGVRKRRPASTFLVPMDDAQPEPLRAYGVVYRALAAGGTAEWLLNFRGGAFVVHLEAAYEESLARGVMTEAVSMVDVARLSEAGLAAPVELEIAPSIAVYAPPYAAPWDDAVRLALEYAEIPHRILWDREVLDGALAEVDWLHLHHEDFTGQYGKYGLNVRSTQWYRAAVELDRQTSAELGFADARALKRAVASRIRTYVEEGGFLFAMCAATETLDVALATDRGFGATLAFEGFAVEEGEVGPFSSIDGHRVNTPDRLPLEAVELAQFAPTVDPVAAMLTQNHRIRFPDWYGLTTSFRPQHLKPGVVALASCSRGALAKYVHGDLGAGTFTFLGGHDPEDPQHAIGDLPTDLEFHPQSPGYRLILNNVLFPAARQEERKT